MSEFEYSNPDTSESEDEIVHNKTAKRKKPDLNIAKIFKEMRLYYSSLFTDSFYLINSFIKSKQLTYDSFLRQFDAMNFHQIYAKTKGDVQQTTVSPHHFITTTQDALAVATKFLRSHSEKARIGAIYLLYTVYKTQPLKTYPLNIRMEPKDYANTKKLVDKCLNNGLLHPAYCFYVLDVKKRITISAAAINPCLEANYPRPEIRKHMAIVADNYFQTEYEEREEFDIQSMVNKFQLIEQQMRSEMTYLNKLSNLSLGHDVGPEYTAELSNTLEDIVNKSDQKAGILTNKQNDEPDLLKKGRYRNSKNIAFPGVNEDMLEDMVTTVESQEPIETTNNCNSNKKQKPNRKRKRRQRRKINTPQTSEMKKEHGASTSSMVPKLSALINSDSDSSSTDSDEYTNGEDHYGDMIWRILEGGDT